MHNSWLVRVLLAILVAFPMLVAGGSGWLAPFPMDVKSHEANLPFGASYKPLCETDPPPLGECHLLGTDGDHQDFTSMLLRAVRTSFLFALLGTGLILLGATWCGLMLGTMRQRWVVTVVSALLLGVMAVPDLALLVPIKRIDVSMLHLSTFQAADLSNLLVLATLALLWSPAEARLLADRVRSVTSSPYVAGSRSIGASWFYVWRKDVYPQIREELAISAARVFPRLIHIEAGLSLIGLGYENFYGLGMILAHLDKTEATKNTTVGMQMFLTVTAIVWLALWPQLTKTVIAWLASWLQILLRWLSGQRVTSDDAAPVNTPVCILPAPPRLAVPNPEAAQHVLSIRNLRVTRPDGKAILDGLSLDFPPGCLVGVIGESGAGKSTFLAACQGILPPGLQITGGTIHLRPDASTELVDLTRLTYEQRRPFQGKTLGMVFQDSAAALNPLMSIHDSLVESLLTHWVKPLAEPELQEKLLLLRKAVLEAGCDASGLELEELMIRKAMLEAGCGASVLKRWLQARPGQLSGGERHRLLIAHALLHRPAVLLFDEPTAALDPETGEALFAAIKARVVKDGTTAVVVTHDLGAVANNADWIYVLYAGRILEAGPAREVVGNPRHPYTRGLLASIPRMDRKMPLHVLGGSAPAEPWKICGCKFQDRCREEKTLECEHQEPALRLLDPVLQHEVACHVC